MTNITWPLRYPLGQSNSLVEGGIVSGLGTSTLNISAGRGIFVDYNTPAGSDNPRIKNISWGDTQISTTGVSLLYVIYVKEDSSIEVAPASSSKQILDITGNYIQLGFYYEASSIITTAISLAILSSTPIQRSMRDLQWITVELTNLRGNIISAGGSNKTIAKSAGELIHFGANWTNDKNNPNTVSSAATNPSTLVPVYLNGSNTAVLSAPSTDLDTSNWNNGGTLAATSSGSWYVYQCFLQQETNIIYYVYPSAAYSNRSLAIQSIPLNLEGVPEVAKSFMPLGYVICKGGTSNLSNTAQASFFQKKDRFVGSTGFGTYSHSGSTQTLTDGVRTALVNDNLGPNTDETSLPPTVTTFFDGTTDTIIPHDLHVGDTVMVRIDGTLKPLTAASDAELGLKFQARDSIGGSATFSFNLSKTLPYMSTVGKVYPFNEGFMFTIDSEEVSFGEITPEIESDGSNLELTLTGYKVIKV